MNYILIDAGNSRVKVTNSNVATDRISSWSTFEYETLHENLFKYLTPAKADGVVLCNVNNDKVVETVGSITQKLWNLEPYVVKVEKSAYQVTTNYSDFTKLGADRWVAMISARQHYNKNLCIIDCGTAITIDVINCHGIHLGGLIAPGLRTARKVLGVSASNLPDTGNVTDNNLSLLATNTQDGIVSGTLLQVRGYIDYVIKRLLPGFDGQLELVATGGDAELILAARQDVNYRPDLVLDGLRIIAENVFHRKTL